MNNRISMLPVCLLVLLLGCMKEPTETPTKGKLHIVVDESVAPLFNAETERFESLYQQTKITVDTARSREAIVQFFNIESTQVISTTRKLNDEEVSVAKRTNLEYHEFHVAINAIAIIVNPKNPVKQLRTTQLDSIYRGVVTTWNAVGGRRAPIEVCLPDQNSGAFEIVATKVLQGKKYAQPAAMTRTSPEMIRWVSSHPDGMGMVSVNWLKVAPDSVGVLEIGDPQAPDSLDIKGKYFAPFQAYIYQKYYPLTADVYMYSKADMYSPGAGFITFVASVVGQKIVQSNGLVPATLPVRLVQLNQKGSE